MRPSMMLEQKQVNPYQEMPLAIKRAALSVPCLPDLVHHEPVRFLLDTDIPAQLDAGYRLESRQAQIDGNRPLAHRNVGMGHRCAGADTEIRPAMIAKIRHRFGIRNFFCIFAAACPAMTIIRPQAVFKPPDRCLVVGKHIHHLNKRQSVSIGFPSHDQSPFADD